ncbi:TetR family transcriptional regulator [Mobilisporobacter senegalensis]|uniref:TetR family transcriptional regulator n=1 Tax=Mobilisporobacter senegalensis TaxID=1329262 RepID=A0A3N1XP88_9FIRM|nr:TetR/AcrR family transcriptional regulator [Mobilisporobacter senegalensis]ROR28465.1 TetR family transcriptional regulator [Mobilisporobacter senegalensis]
MFEKFYALDVDKQKRILNAAMKEFDQKGYKNASTNEIVKDANIGKGMLFHYFKSKKDLFLFLYDYTLDILMNEFYEKINLNERDILKRLRQVIVIKFNLINRHPDMLNFIKSAYFDNSDEIKEDLELRNSDYITIGNDKVLDNVDISKFKEGIDIERVIHTIMWTFEGVSSREREKLKKISLNELNYNNLLTELDAYIELFRESFYK